MSDKQPMDLGEKKISIQDVINAIEEEVAPLKNIVSIGLACEKIDDLLGQLEELIDHEIVIPPIKCPACTNQSGISKGCPVCNQTGIISHPVVFD